MLLDRATNLATKIADYEKIKASAHEAEHFRTRSIQFTNVAQQLGRARLVLTRLRESGAPVDFIPADAGGLAEKAATLRAEVAKDPSVLADPPFDLKHAFVDRLIAIAAAAEKASISAWRQWVEQKSNLSSEDVLTALSALPQFRASIATIRQCRVSITTLAATVPQDPNAAKQRLDELLTAHNAAWSELTAEGIPAAVLAFIRACAGEGAPIGLLTTEVLEWLTQRSLMNAFRIKIR